MKDMNRFFIVVILALAINFNVYGQEDCKDPNFRVTFKEKFKEIGTTDPWFLNDATVIFYKSLVPRSQWVGIYKEGPVSGALLAYDCTGKLLSIQETGGIKSIQFFNAPRDVAPAIAVEEVFTGTGHYYIQYSIYSLVNGKISKLWQHTKYESNFVIPSKDGIVDFFEFDPSGPPEQMWRKMTVEGVRKVYPVNKDGFSDFRVEKLPTEWYCWNHDKKTYLHCK